MLATPSLVQYADSRTHVTGTGLLKPDTYPQVLVPRVKSSARGRTRSMCPYRGRGAGVGAGLHPRRASGFVSRAGVHDASVCCLFRGANAVAEETSAQTTTRWRMLIFEDAINVECQTWDRRKLFGASTSSGVEETPSFCLLSRQRVHHSRRDFGAGGDGCPKMSSTHSQSVRRFTAATASSPLGAGLRPAICGRRSRGVLGQFSHGLAADRASALVGEVGEAVGAETVRFTLSSVDFETGGPDSGSQAGNFDDRTLVLHSWHPPARRVSCPSVDSHKRWCGFATRRPMTTPAAPVATPGPPSEIAEPKAQGHHGPGTARRGSPELPGPVPVSGRVHSAGTPLSLARRDRERVVA